MVLKNKNSIPQPISNGVNTKTKIILAIILVVTAITGRFVPHAWNFTPLVAVSLFAGAKLGSKYAVIVPLATMAISDVFIGLYDPKMMVAVYASFICSAFIGKWLLQNKTSFSRMISASFGSSLLFFIATNSAVWAFGTMYSKTLVGLGQSLVAGIPFFRNMIAGDAIFTFSVFGVFALGTFFVKKYKILGHQKTVNI